MCANKADPNNAIVVIDFYHQTIMISFDVKYDAIIDEKTGAWIFPLYIIWPPPMSILCFFEPGFKLLFAVGMSGPECSKGAFSNHSHTTKIQKVP